MHDFKHCRVLPQPLWFDLQRANIPHTMANAATEVMVGELLEALSAVLADPSAQDNPNVMRTVTEVPLEAVTTVP